MKTKDNIIEAFFALLRAGLWERSTQLLPKGLVDFDKLYRLADDQSVVGLIAAGLEHVEDKKIAKSEALPFLKKVVSIEKRNQEMNDFIEGLVQRMRDKGIYSILVKGQGIAQCYSRPLWRSAGDVDLFLSERNYEKAKSFLLSQATSSEQEGLYTKHFGVTINTWVVELHGTLRSGLSSRIDNVIDAVQEDTFTGGKIRVWRCGESDIFLPHPDNDIIYVFTHILKHFYKGGIGLRQICDLNRLLWTFRNSIDVNLLSDRLQKMRLLSEWKAFAAYMVDYLGMPIESMPLFDSSSRWSRKARRINGFIMRVGNFGFNRDMSYYEKRPYIIRKLISFERRCVDMFHHLSLFPMDTLIFFPSIIFHGISSAVKGE